MGLMVHTRGSAERGEMRAVVGVNALDVAVCVCVRGRVGLGGHDPSKRREGRVDVLLLFFHVRRSRVWLGRGKEWSDEGRGKKK